MVNYLGRTKFTSGRICVKGCNIRAGEWCIAIMKMPQETAIYPL